MEVVKLDPNEKNRDNVQITLEGMCEHDIVKFVAVCVDSDGFAHFSRANMSDQEMLWYSKQLELKALED